MSQSTLLVAIGAILGGIAVLMTALAAAFEPLLLVVAVPFAASGYLIWYQGTGRLAARARRRARSRDGAARARRVAGTSNAGPRPDDDGPSRWADTEAWDRRARARRQAARATTGTAKRDGDAGRRRERGWSRERHGSDQPTSASEMSEREAYRVLDVDPGSADETVKQAYRQRVKNTHPDTDGGDEEAFKRVTEAYERLGGR